MKWAALDSKCHYFLLLIFLPLNMILGSQLELQISCLHGDFGSLPRTKERLICLSGSTASDPLNCFPPRNSEPHYFRGEGARRRGGSEPQDQMQLQFRPRTEEPAWMRIRSDLQSPSQQSAYMSARCQATVWFANTLLSLLPSIRLVF